MNTYPLLTGRTGPGSAAGRSALTRTSVLLLPLLLLLALPGLAQAQFGYIVDNGTVTITSYWGPGGEVVIPDTIHDRPVVALGEECFSGCASLTSINIPLSVKGIGQVAFSGCSGLTNLTLPTGLNSIAQGAFEGCSSLTDLTIPGNVTSIGQLAFAGCTSLTIVTLPSTLTKIPKAAFRNCSSLTSIAIPDSVTSIGDGAFQKCSSLVRACPKGRACRQA